MRTTIILLFPVIFGLQVVAQDPELEQKVDRLKKQLPLLKDTARVNCLSSIARAYLWTVAVHSDSGLVYALRAYKEANAIHYTKGACIAAEQCGKLFLQLSLPDEGLKYYRITTRLARALKMDKLEADGIRGVGQALWYQGFFQPAIDTIYSAIPYFRRLDNNRAISDATMTISCIYGDQGNYEKAFETAQQAVTLSKRWKDEANLILSLVQLGKLYAAIGDYSTAKEYYRQGYGYHPPGEGWGSRHLAHCMGDIYQAQHRYDSALYYYRQSFAGNPGSKLSQLKMGQYYLAKQQYDSALVYFNRLYRFGEKGGEGHIFLDAMLGLGQVHLQRKEYKAAMDYGYDALRIAQRTHARLNIRDASLLLSAVYEALGYRGQALSYFRQHILMKDSIISDQFKGRLFEFRRVAENEKNVTRTRMLAQERLISRQQFRENRLLKRIILAVIFSLMLLSGVVYWNIRLKRRNEKLKNERIQADFELRTTELEMQALRAQMNPHFIFNCLSSINRFIIKNEPDKASDYLTRFSRLIRLVLINSQKTVIVLEDEIEMLRLYIGLEQLRFNHAFDYTISYADDISTGNILLPPLLLQPFCENAIWHGLMHKKGHGQLDIVFARQKDNLVCTITDNGVGRARAGEMKTGPDEKIKSLGLTLTTERLALFNKRKSAHTFYRIEDIKDEKGQAAGTRVILEIRHKTFIEETTGKKYDQLHYS